MTDVQSQAERYKCHCDKSMIGPTYNNTIRQRYAASCNMADSPRQKLFGIASSTIGIKNQNRYQAPLNSNDLDFASIWPRVLKIV